MVQLEKQHATAQNGKVVYTAKTHTSGGRENGVSRSSDGRLDVKLSLPGAVRIGTTTSDAGLEASAFRNSDGSTAVIVLSSAHSRQTATFSLRGLRAAHVTPYLTDTTHQLSAQTPITVSNSAFTATLPPRSLVTYDIRS